MFLAMHKILTLLTVIAVSSAYNVQGRGRAPNSPNIVNPFVCAPGSSFKLDCNFCGCGETPGEVGPCTRIGCNLGPDECIPGSYFKVQRALCKCPPCSYKWHSDCFQPRPEGYCG